MDYSKFTVNELTDNAERLEEAGMLEEALEYWKAALGRETDPVTLCQYGSLAMRLDKWSDAERAFLSAIEIAPELPNPYSHLGMLYLEQGDCERAQEYFSKSAGIEETASVLTLLGVSQLECGSVIAARGSFLRAL